MLRVGRVPRNFVSVVVCCSFGAIIVVLLLRQGEVARISAAEEKLEESAHSIVRPPVSVVDSDEIHGLIEEGWRQHEFNHYASELISVNRSISDRRSDECRRLTYGGNLSETSVIVTFYNEAWSTLLRTVHSVLNRGGKHVREVILVDDFSDMDHLKEPLSSYMKDFPKVKIIRTKERIGLIKARIAGTHAATAPVLTFLDSHVECAEGWLEPLLSRIAQQPKAVVVPVIDTIDASTFEYQWITDVNAIPLGGFDWKMGFKWFHSFDERFSPTLPIQTPTMAGGLFAIDKSFFHQLGLYDSELELWGGENLELSFKSWMCGGTLEIIPCSHVGHVFRTKSPYNKDRAGRRALRRNLIRVARVWMDDYAKFVLMRIRAREADFSDVEARMVQRRQCESFKWYLERVYRLQFDPSVAVAQGKLQSAKFASLCVEMTPPAASLAACRNNTEQFIVLSADGELRRDDFCLSRRQSGLIKFDYCMGLESQRAWSFNGASRQLQHSAECLAIDIDGALTLAECGAAAAEQRWTFEFSKNTHY